MHDPASVPSFQGLRRAKDKGTDREGRQGTREASFTQTHRPQKELVGEWKGRLPGAGGAHGVGGGSAGP